MIIFFGSDKILFGDDVILFSDISPQTPDFLEAPLFTFTSV